MVVPVEVRPIAGSLEASVDLGSAYRTTPKYKRISSESPLRFNDLRTAWLSSSRGHYKLISTQCARRAHHHDNPQQTTMCTYDWVEVICPCNKGSNCCMRNKPKLIIHNRFRHTTGRLVPIKETAQRCQFRRRNAKGGWAAPDCKFSERKDAVGTQLSVTPCFWCALDCETAPVDDEVVYQEVVAQVPERRGEVDVHGQDRQ